MTSFRSVRLRTLSCLIVLLLLLAACGGDDDSQDEDRSFAPEIHGDTQLPTTTPAPTSTFAPLDIQPGESGQSSADAGQLLDQTGPAKAVLSGLNTFSIVKVDSGEAAELGVPRGTSTSVTLSPDGTRAVIVDRTGTATAVRMIDDTGKVVGEWSPAADASPVASPVANDGASAQIADRVVWSRDSSNVAIWVSGAGLHLADTSLAMRPVDAIADMHITAMAWSPSAKSLAVALWNGDTDSAAIVSVNVDSPAAAPGTLMQTAESDGRFIRSMAWGNERVGIVFALRSVGSGSTLPNDLYMVPRFGEPMRLLASAGVAAPAAAIDQISIADDGATVAFTVLVPGQVGLRLHSIWVTSATSAEPVRLDSSGLRRVTDISWTERGLVVSAIRRNRSETGYVQIAVVESLKVEGADELFREASPATPFASPVASPVSSPVDSRQP